MLPAMPAIAVDAMGGLQAPEAVVRGVAEVSLHTDIQCALVGDVARLHEILEKVSYDPARIELVNATQAIGFDEDPEEAVRDKRDASLPVAMRLVADGHCAAVVTAGSPAAAIAAGRQAFPLLPGVTSVAQSSVHPRAVEYEGQDRLALLLDVGATARCDAAELVRFAVMGSAYARVISKVASPRVALLNMERGSRDGGPVLVEAFRRLNALPGLNFIGNIAGDQLTSGRADVVVCEGLLGNIVLRILESVATMAVDLSASAAQRTWRWRAGMAIMASGVDRLRALADYASYGGAPILGFEQLIIKAHRRTSAQSIANAVKVAAKAVRDGAVEEVAGALAAMPAEEEAKKWPRR